MIIAFPLYKQSYSHNKQEDILKADLEVMTFNARLFNKGRWIERDDVDIEIEDFLNTSSPDVICFQEYSPVKRLNLSKWPHRYVEYRIRGGYDWGHAIFSKYPIKAKGNLDFANSHNNAIYVDVLLPSKNTVRVYNFHMQSLKIKPEEFMDETEDMNKEKLKNLLGRTNASFIKQEKQAEELRAHLDACPHPKIVGGDLNNTTYSYTYRTLEGSDLRDCFTFAGNGFGKTFNAIPLVPLRIDVILSDKNFSIVSFETHKRKISDHYPVSAGLKLR